MLLLLAQAPSVFPSAEHALLMERGLTRREATNVEARHRRLHREMLRKEELLHTFSLLDALGLEKGQAVHLLRTSRLRELASACTEAAARPPTAPRWCHFKKALCNCEAQLPSLDAAPSAPRLVALDCEFEPLRCAAVDERRTVVLNHIVTRDGTPERAPGVLSCDRALLPSLSIADLHSLLTSWSANGAVLVGHTLVRADPPALTSCLVGSESLRSQRGRSSRQNGSLPPLVSRSHVNRRATCARSSCSMSTAARRRGCVSPTWPISALPTTLQRSPPPCTRASELPSGLCLPRGLSLTAASPRPLTQVRPV